MSGEKYTTKIRIGSATISTGDLNADTLLKVGRMERLLSDIRKLKGDEEWKRRSYPDFKPLTEKEKKKLYDLSKVWKALNEKANKMDNEIQRLRHRQDFGKLLKDIQEKEKEMKAIKF